MQSNFVFSGHVLTLSFATLATCYEPPGQVWSWSRFNIPWHQDAHHCNTVSAAFAARQSSAVTVRWNLRKGTTQKQGDSAKRKGQGKGRGKRRSDGKRGKKGEKEKRGKKRRPFIKWRKWYFSFRSKQFLHCFFFLHWDRVHVQELRWDLSPFEALPTELWMVWWLHLFRRRLSCQAFPHVLVHSFSGLTPMRFNQI